MLVEFTTVVAFERPAGGQRDGGGPLHLLHVHRPRLWSPLLRQERLVRPFVQEHDGGCSYCDASQPTYCRGILNH